MPHWSQRRRADDERVAGFGFNGLKLLQNLGADESFAQADHVANVAAAVFGDDVQAALDGVQLEVGQLGATPAGLDNRAAGFAVVEFVEGFEINIVRLGFGHRPGMVELGQGQLGDVGGVLPEVFEPGVQFGDFASVKADIQLGVAREPGQGEVGRPDNGRALDGHPVVMADVGFGVQPLFEVGADFQPAGGDEVANAGYALLFAVRLRRTAGGAAHLPGQFSAQLVALGAADGRMRRQVFAQGVVVVDGGGYVVQDCPVGASHQDADFGDAG